MNKDYKKDFKMFESNPNMVYLDSAATALKPKCVLEKMEEYYNNYGVNVHRGAYYLSYQASVEYDEARETVANFINAQSKEVFFVRNATEGLNVVSKMLRPSLSQGDHVLCSILEHHSNILPWMRMENEGIVLDYIEPDDIGRISLENVKAAINENTKILTITYASNTLGYITDVKEITKYAHSKGLIVVCDASQMIPHKRVDVIDLDVDFLIFSGHKIMGPTGIGVVYGKYDILKDLDPVLYGGDMNADVDYHKVLLKECPEKFEAGTPAIAEAMGLAEAIRYIDSIGYDYIDRKEKELHQYALSKLEGIEGISVYNKESDLAIILFNIDGVHPHDASSFFDNNGVCLRAGHHCAQLVSRFLGQNGGTLRASMYFYNTFEDIDKFIKSVKEVVDFFKDFK